MRHWYKVGTGALLSGRIVNVNASSVDNALAMARQFYPNMDSVQPMDDKEVDAMEKVDFRGYEALIG